MPNWGDLLHKHEGLPPPRVPGFRVLKLIGGHGQSEVYLAEDALGSRVAIKRWKLPSPRAKRELEALERLAAPGIVRVLGATEDAELGLPCLIMEFVDAPQLLADGGRLEPADACRVARALAASLVHVHAAELIHRDIKPANVLVSAEGAVVLVDFGIVKDEARPNQTALTARGGGVVGTLPYMSPEQLGLSSAPVDARADLYGLGATLYQCLTGAVPFETDGAYEREHRDVWGDPPPGAEVEQVPANLRELIRSCLAYPPSGRPPDAQSVVSQLDAILAAPASSPGAPRLLWGLALGSLSLLGAALAFSLAARPSHSASPNDASPQDMPPLPTLAHVASESAPHELALQPGVLLGCDTYVSSAGLYPNDNFGNSPTLRAGFRPASAGQAGELRSFLRFNLERVPQGAQVLEAWLELRCLRAAYAPGALPLEVACVLPSSGGRTPWREGTGGLDQTLDGLVWSGVFRGPSPASSSAVPACSQPEAGPPLAHGLPQADAWLRLDVRAALEAWLSGAENHGLRVAPPASAPRLGHWIFHSSESAEPALRPRLVIRYRGAAPVPEPSEATLYPAAVAEARAQLARARELLAGGAEPRALELLHAAAHAAPFWGEPLAARAELSARLGWSSASRVDIQGAFGALRPTLARSSYRLLASGHLSQPGLSARVQGLAVLLVLACDPLEGDWAERTIAAVLRSQPDLRAGLEQPALRATLASELDWLAVSQARAEPEDGAPLPALPLAYGLLLQAQGNEAQGARVLARASALAPGDPLVAELISPRAQTPRAERLRLSCLLGAEGSARALPLLRAALERWPEDPALARLLESLASH